ncbi:MAG: hypothetical protein PUF62_08820 [Bacteroidales bacterium]|nr:hypothetical protein [Bacteroidales bacterium]
MATFCTAQIRRYRTTLSGRRAAEKPQEQPAEAESVPTATTAADNELIAGNPDDKDTTTDINDPAKDSSALSRQSGGRSKERLVKIFSPDS